MGNPLIIQGGMGVSVSSWWMAKKVSMKGQLGVVSGTGLATLMIRRLQSGDPDGHVRRALSHFPSQDMANEYLDQYFVEGGIGEGGTYKRQTMHTLQQDLALDRLTVLGAFVEVFLAKEGHDGPIGVNLLEKIQLPTMATLLGSMLANVDYVIMGAGIPLEIPGVLDCFARGERAELSIDVDGAGKEDDFKVSLDPAEVLGDAYP